MATGRPTARLGARWRVLSRATGPYLLAALIAVPLGALAITQVLERAGEAALPLDDAFIHLQYARRLAEGHWFSYVPGEGYTTGATSLLWPAVLAPFVLIGWDGLSIIWVTWALGLCAHVAVAVETGRVAAGLAGRLAGLFAGAMCAVFGAFVWFAYSGMETIPLAWLLIRTVRVASEACETNAPNQRLRIEVALLGLAGPLLRPEGALATVIALAALVGSTGWRRRSVRRRIRQALLLVVPMAGLAIQPLLHWMLAGQPASSTAMVKWLPLDPYLDRGELAAAVFANAHFLWTNLLHGGPWTSVFLPPYFGVVVAAGSLCVVMLGSRRGRRWLGLSPPGAGPASASRVWRAGFVLALILATLVVTTYGTMLWNRVRYLWPFAPGWFVAVACLGAALGRWAARRRPVLEILTPALLGSMVGALCPGLPWVLYDLAVSARAITKQQVELARWAVALPPDALIGVNDTGAIAYLSGRRTFDVVGLTTASEARYWVAGAGSRFEHYERLGRSQLPSHFIVYPEWMACAPVLATELHRETVVEQTILGGQTMVAYEARYDLLDSGTRPFTSGSWGRLLDELDVADLESEHAHGYVLGKARAADNAAVMWPTPDGRLVADGGRFDRQEDRFSVQLPPAVEAVMVLRVVAPGGVQVWIDGQALPPKAPSGPSPALHVQSSWVESSFELPSAPVAQRAVVVRSADDRPFASFHYWFFARPRSPSLAD